MLCWKEEEIKMTVLLKFSTGNSIHKQYILSTKEATHYSSSFQEPQKRQLGKMFHSVYPKIKKTHD